MYLHIGGDVVISLEGLIGIFDTRIGDSASNDTFFQRALASDSAHVIDPSDIKSVVLTQESIYFSPVSSWTLKKRAFAFADSESFELHLEATHDSTENH